MAQLAIKGHATRGKEVIEILEMLGGENKYHINITEGNLLYTIREGDDAIIATYPNSSISQIYTLEEFLEKFPYKVGDKVIIKAKNQEAIIDKIVWCCNTITYWLKYDGIIEGNWRVKHLHPYKEETMERKYNVEEYLEVWEETEKGLEVVVNNNFELKEDNGKFYIIKKQLQYPKTHEECFNICFGNKHHIVQVVGLDDLGDNKELFERFIKLKICRDAYWKIAGDWKPNWKDFSTQKYSISIDKDDIILSQRVTGSRIFVFPTAEMRDAFYENFKELINDCKELL